MTFFLALLLTVSVPTVDSQGRACFNALRDFEKVEAIRYQSHVVKGTKDDQWPSDGQHARITILLADVRLALTESLTAALTVTPTRSTPDPVRNLILHGQRALEQLRVITSDPTAPPGAKDAIKKAVTAYEKLRAAF